MTFNPDWSLPEATAERLRELQGVWQRRMNSAEDKVMEGTLRDVLDELDAAARALGIQEAGE